ncbi:MAG TPA: hypothetical protein VK081_03505 [Planctomycetota bacterium]|nr:hypothetical protein [Planctomycetota bacterium]
MPANNPRPSPADRILARLRPLTNYERTRTDKPRWSLDNMRALLARPGAARLRGRAVQVGGSKGKGTTALYLGALARALGLRSGVYLSPHVGDLTERVQVDGRPADDLEEVVGALLDHVGREGLADVTFFEVMTAAAVECFARAGVDLAVFEVGLGGRLDATTAIPVDASILTNVELEHTELLGDTVEAIAAEKAHVVRPGGLAFTGAREPALSVIAHRAAEVGATLRVRGRDFTVEAAVDGWRSVRGVVEERGVRLPFTLPDAAAFEAEALCFAACCARALWPERAAAIAAALDPVAFRPELPARFERLVTRAGLAVVDGAHTEQSLRATTAEAQRLAPGHRWAVLFGSAAGKQWRTGLSCLAPLVDTLYVTTVEGTTSEDPGAICAYARSVGMRAVRVEGVAEGLAALRRHAPPWLVTGSFYLAGEARRLLLAEIVAR